MTSQAKKYHMKENNLFKKIVSNPHTLFWLLACSILTGLTLPVLLKDGMFMDAVLYTSVSHNLSMGIGNFWFPQFSLHNVADLPAFHEQPPLVFGIQSVFFRLLGGSLYVERVYTFLTMCVSALLIVLLWRAVFVKENNLKKAGWLPVILWITIPVCFWSYSNNMHENTMGIFTLSSALITYKTFHKERFQIILIIFSGILIFLATFSKGIPGFFPLTLPFLYWLITKKISFKKMFVQTLILVFIPILIYVILFQFPESKESLSAYFFKRALHRINEVPTVDSRFYILYRIFTELLPQMIVVLIFLLIARIKKIKNHVSEHLRESIFFIAVGLSASVPLMLTLVQKGFYFVPALPFFAIGLSILIGPIISNFIEKIKSNTIKYKVLLFLVFLLFAGTCTFALMQKGKFSRNEDMLHDIYLMGSVIPQRSIAGIPGELWNDWSLQCYMMRYFNISMDCTIKYDYAILDKSIKPTDKMDNYKKVEINTLIYDLYRRQQ